MGCSLSKLLVGFGKRTWTSWSTHTQPLFYFPTFFLDSKNPWCSHEFIAEIGIDELHSLVKPHILSQSISWKPPCKAHFEKTFLSLQHSLHSGLLRKAVPFVFEEASSTISKSLLAHSIFHLLEYAQKFPVHVYGFWDTREGILGATPEVLFTLDREKLLLETMACAGTAATAQNENLLKSPKDIHEHQLVVDGIVQSLTRFGSIDISSPKVVSFGQLSHIITPIVLKMDSDIPYEMIISALHPTPALGAFPKEAGNSWLLDYEAQLPRGRFGAPVGFMNESKMSCYVGIRNMQWNNGCVKIGAGCGVVPQSIFEHEWSEIQQKICAIKAMLGHMLLIEK